jgi:predicted F0F1-ATPase subunit
MKDESHRRGDLRDAVERDLARRRRRETGSFWRSLALIGSVGWPIALLSAGGAWLGHAIDSARGTGVRYTLLLLCVGTGVGAALAWRVARRGP